MWPFRQNSNWIYSFLETSPRHLTATPSHDIRWPHVPRAHVTSGISAVVLYNTSHTHGRVWPRREEAWCNPNRNCRRYHRSYDNDAKSRQICELVHQFKTHDQKKRALYCTLRGLSERRRLRKVGERLFMIITLHKTRIPGKVKMHKITARIA